VNVNVDRLVFGSKLTGCVRDGVDQSICIHQRCLMVSSSTRQLGALSFFTALTLLVG